MKTQSFEQQVTPYTAEVERMQVPINELIALADKTDSYDVAVEVAHIIDGMRDAQSISQQFGQLEAIARLQFDLPEVEEVVSDTAEILLHEVENGKVPPKAIGLNLVWSTIRAWDSTRDQTTSNLCVKILDSYKGAGQANLARAYAVAIHDGLPFDEALDEVLAA